AQLERRQAVRQFARVIFAQEEVIVVELHGIHAVGAGQMTQDRFGARGWLHLLAAPREGHHTAKVATKRTPDARLVDRRSTAKKSGQKIPLDRDAVVRIPGKVIERPQGTFGIVAMVPLAILV